MKAKLMSVIVPSVGLLMIATVGIHAVENLIVDNPDFEEGQGGWGVAARGAAMMQYVIDDEESILGKQSARFEVSNIGDGGTHDLTLDCGTPISIEAGETYTVDFWVRAEEDRTLTIDLLMNHDPWTRPDPFQVENIPVTTEWQVQHQIFKAGFSDTNMVFLFSFSKASNKNPTTIMWIDHVRFYEGEYEEEDLLGESDKAVTPGGKLTASWGMVKLENCISSQLSASNCIAAAMNFNTR
jgi:hypothetical protein